MFDWRSFLDQNRIPYVTEGANTPRGSLGIKCPFCGSADPSEHMVLKPFGAYWHCWRDRAHRGSNPTKLVQAILGCSLAKAHDLTRSHRSIPPISADLHEQIALSLAKSSLVAASSLAAVKYPQMPAQFREFGNDYAAQPFLTYLANRGFHELVSRPDLLTFKYNLHYCVSGPFKGRIIFPVVQDGNLISWTGRSIYPASKKIHRYKSLTTDPEKAQEMGLEPAAAPLNNALLWQDQLQGGKTLVITEGPFDALKVRYLGQADGVTATCLFTSMPTPKQMAIIRGLAPKYDRVVSLMDSDAWTKNERIRQQLSPILTTAWLTHGDPGDIKDREELLDLLDRKVEPFPG